MDNELKVALAVLSLLAAQAAVLGVYMYAWLIRIGRPQEIAAPELATRTVPAPTDASGWFTRSTDPAAPETIAPRQVEDGDASMPQAA